MNQNHEIIDSFPNQTRVYANCKTHKQHTLRLVCLNDKCESKGLICVDCLVYDHQKQKCQIKKIEDFEMELSKLHTEKNQKFSQQIIQLKQQQKEVIELKINILQLLNHQEIQYQHQIEELEKSKLSSKQLRDLAKLIREGKFLEFEKQIKGEEVKVIENNLNLQDFENYLQASRVFIETNKVLIGAQKVEKKEMINLTTCRTLQGLEQYDASITELRIKLKNPIKNQEFYELRRFYQLNYLQLGLSTNEGTPEQINKLITRIGEIKTLKYLHINFSFSNVNEECLNNLFNIAGHLSLSQLSIMLDFVELTEDLLIELLKRNAHKLDKVQEFKFYNQRQYWNLSELGEVLKTLQIITQQ